MTTRASQRAPADQGVASYRLWDRQRWSASRWLYRHGLSPAANIGLVRTGTRRMRAVHAGAGGAVKVILRPPRPPRVGLGAGTENPYTSSRPKQTDQTSRNRYKRITTLCLRGFVEVIVAAEPRQIELIDCSVQQRAGN